ncbi:MAG: MerR family transcriptional regulator [Symbiopectobacterium sp.]|uniref:MerR family transcriptional regulator n=1 Tax=Symbiopectobacterium sp. TaxID=2952789 RepID=UPI0039E8491B
MQIGKLAELTGVSIRMLHYYENVGLLHPTRTETGYRYFAPQDADVVRRIVMLNWAGFTLPVIASVLNCARGSHPL